VVGDEVAALAADRDRIEDVERMDPLWFEIAEPDQCPYAISLTYEWGGEQLWLSGERLGAIDVPGTQYVVARNRPCAEET
jgi:hypothetical protein